MQVVVQVVVQAVVASVSDMGKTVNSIKFIIKMERDWVFLNR
jgi:hypothetical protein